MGSSEHSWHSTLGGSLTTANYWSEQHFEDELNYVFRRAWIIVCREDAIPDPGDFLTQNLYALGTSVILIRGNDRNLRAFHNTCAHRGNRVENDHVGNKKWFSCSFHGWTYDAQGSLVSAPKLHRFNSVNKAEIGLAPIHLDTWGGFAFICLATQPPCTLEEFMRPISRRLDAHLGDQPWHLSFRLGIEVNCNWKLPNDAVIEFYHLNVLHQKSIGGGLDSSTITLYSDQMGVVGNLEGIFTQTKEYLEPTPIQQLASELGAGGIHTKSKVNEFKSRYQDAINPGKRADWAASVFAVLPHTALSMTDQSMVLQRSWPIAVDRCYWSLDLYTLAPPPRTFAEVFNTSAVRSRTIDILSEDMSTLERIQSGLVHGPIHTFHFSADEALVKGMQDLIQAWIDRGRPSTKKRKHSK